VEVDCGREEWEVGEEEKAGLDHGGCCYAVSLTPLAENGMRTVLTMMSTGWY
jgi:hypothetical protein